MKKVLMTLSAALAVAIVGCATCDKPCEKKCDKKCEKACEKKCDKAKCTCVDCGCAKKAARPASPSCRSSKLPYKLGVAR